MWRRTLITYSIFIYYILLFMYLMYPAAVYGAEGENTVRVVASEIDEAEKIRSLPGKAEVIDCREFRGRAVTLEDILKKRAGIHVARYGGRGSFSTIKIRGSGGSQVEFYLNGVPINDIMTGSFDPGEISAGGLERIEIYRGAVPGNFGRGSIGGAVNLVTAKGKIYGGHYIKALYGSFGTMGAEGGLAFRKNSYSLDLMGGGEKSRGDFPYTYDGGTPVLNSADDREVKRNNNDYRFGHGACTARYAEKNEALEVRNNFYYRQRGMAGLNSNEVLKAGTETTRNVLAFRYREEGHLMERLTSDWNIYHRYRKKTFRDPEGEIGIGAREEMGTFHSGGLRGAMVLAVPELYQEISLTLASSFDRGDIDRKGDFFYEPLQRGSRKRAEGTLQDEIFFFTGRVRLVPVLRFDYLKEEMDFTEGENEEKTVSSYHDGSVGAVADLWKERIRLRGSAGLDHRVPALYERYGDGGIITGNSGIEGERSFLWEGGGDFRFSGTLYRCSFSYTFFRKDVDEAILYIYNSQNTMMARNIGGALVHGHELSASFASKYTDLAARYTYQKGKDRGEIPFYRDNYLPHSPLHEGGFSVTAKYGIVQIEYDFDYMGANFRDRANSRFYYIERRVYHSVTGRIGPWNNISLSLEVKNIGNDMTRDIIGYPLPGRSFYAVLKYSTGDKKNE